MLGVNDKPRILHITNAGGFGRVQRGGGERAVEELSAQFAQTPGWTAAVCAPEQFLEHAHIAESVRKYPVSLGDFALPAALRRRGTIAQTIRDFEPTVAILHLLRGTLVGIPTVKLYSRCSTISILHNSLSDSVEFGGNSTPKKLLNLGLFRSIGRAADAHIAISESNREDLIQRDHMRPDRVRLISNWVSPAFTDYLGGVESTTDLTKRQRPFRLLFVGRLEKQKQPDFVIKLLSQLAPDITLSIVGDGTMRARCEEVGEELRVTDRVEYLGQRRDIAALMADADLVVVPSLFEGFGRVAVEALSVGTRVICSDVAGLRDVLRDAPASSCWLLPTDNAALWVAAVNEARDASFSDAQRSDLRTFAYENFSLAKSADAYRELIATLHAGNSK